MRRALFWALAALVMACSGEGSRAFVAWPETPAGRMDVLVHVESGEHRVRAVALGADEAVRPDPLELSVAGEDALLILRVDLAELLRRVPTFDLARRGELTVRPALEPCTEGRREGDRVNLSLQDGLAEFHELFEDGFVPMESMPVYSLGLPVDDALCGARPPRRFQAFGPAPHLLADGAAIGGGVRDDRDSGWRRFRQAEVIDADRLLVASERAIMLLERGQPWTGEAAKLWIPEDESWVVQRVQRMPAESSEERLTFLVLLWDVVPNQRPPRLVRLRWTEAGFEPPEVLLESVPEARHLDLDLRGRVVISGDEGTIYYGGASSSDPIPRVQVPALFSGIRALVSGHPPDPLHIFVSGQARLHFGDLADPTSFRVEVSTMTYRSPREVASRPGPSGGTEVFYDSESADIYLRRASGERTLLAYKLPRVASGCGERPDACGYQGSSGRTEGLLPEAPDTLIVAPSNCSMVFELDLARGCTRGLELEGIEVRPRAEFFLTTVQNVGDRVLLFGGDGLLMEAR